MPHLPHDYYFYFIIIIIYLLFFSLALHQPGKKLNDMKQAPFDNSLTGSPLDQTNHLVGLMQYKVNFVL